MTIIYESDDLQNPDNREAVKKAFDRLFTSEIIEEYKLTPGRLTIRIPNRANIHADIFRIGAIYGTAIFNRRIKSILNND